MVVEKGSKVKQLEGLLAVVGGNDLDVGTTTILETDVEARLGSESCRNSS